MININISWEGKKGLDSLIRYIEGMDFVRVEAEVASVADKTVEHMKETINSSRKRPDKGTHKLENAIDWTELINNPGRELVIGIGNIGKLKQEAPYFEVLDVGGYVPPANFGYFGAGNSPIVGGSGENWTHTGKAKGSYYMQPKKAIEGIDYIGKAIRNLDKELKETIERLGSKFINGAIQASK